MDIEFKGGNCIVVTTKKTILVVDPKLTSIGLKDQGEKANVQLLTQAQFGANHKEDTVVIDGPGEYEVEGISIKGIPALAHLDPVGSQMKATMYQLNTNDFSMAIIGHIHPDLSEEQFEQLGVVDILVIPVGGNGYTLDVTGAIQLIRAMGPKIVIPTHYAQTGVNYEVPQASLDDFIKELGITPQEAINKLKIKAGSIGDTLLVQPLTRST